MTVREEIERLREQTTQEVVSASDSLTKAHESVAAATAVLGHALFDALEMGLSLSSLAEMTKLSESTVRKYAATSQGVVTVEPEAAEEPTK